MNLSSFVIPVLLAAVAVFGTGKRVDVYGALTRGGEDGLRVLLGIIPSLFRFSFSISSSEILLTLTIGISSISIESSRFISTLPSCETILVLR